MRFIHAVDIHLASALPILDSASVEEIRGVTHRVFDNLSELAVGDVEMAQTDIVGISNITPWEISLLAERSRLRLGREGIDNLTPVAQ